MTAPATSVAPQSSGASGPAYASAQPRTDPIPAASASGPTADELRRAWEAYRGNFRGPLTAAVPGQPDLNVLANRCGSIVRTGVDFLFGPVLKMEHPTADAQDILTATWGNDDRRMTTLSKCRINGGAYGHVFVKIVTPKNKKPMSAQNPPRIVVQNPELYRVETDPDDCELVTRYLCTWQDANDGQMWHRQTTTRIDPDDGADESYANGADDEGPDIHWEIQNWTRTGGPSDDASAWQPQGAPLIWPYPFAPLVDWQNYPNPNVHWGARDVDESIVNLNKQLHLVESNTNAVMYSHGHPWLFNTGDGDTTAITPTPGAITDVPGGNIVAITASGDIPAMQSFSAQIRSDMDEASSTPGVATGRMAELPRGQLSGITVRLLYGPRIMRTEHERRLYGGGIREICRRVLVLCGQETAAREDVSINWQDPLPQDDLAMAQMALALQQLGLSDHTIYQLIGQNYDAEQEWKKQEAQDQMRDMLAGQAVPQLPPPPSDAADGSAGASGQPDASGQPSAPVSAAAGQPPHTAPPVMHPQAIATRQAAQAAAGKRVTATGM